MKKLFKKATSIILTSAMILSTYSVSTAATQPVPEVTHESRISPRAVRINYGTKTINYNSTLDIGRDPFLVKSVMINERTTFIVNPGVPVTIGFNTNDNYVKVYFKDFYANKDYVLFTGVASNFTKSITFNQKVAGHFYIENWTAGSIKVNELYVSY